MWNSLPEDILFEMLRIEGKERVLSPPDFCVFNTESASTLLRPIS